MTTPACTASSAQCGLGPGSRTATISARKELVFSALRRKYEKTPALMLFETANGDEWRAQTSDGIDAGRAKLDNAVVFADTSFTCALDK